VDRSRAAHASTFYSRWAPTFDTSRLTRYLNSRFPRFVEFCDVRTGQRVLDVGCGTGELLNCLARAAPGLELAGLDIASGMLDIARERLPAADLREGSLTDPFPWPDGSFDRVVSTYCFHHAGDPGGTASEMARVLAPGGRLTILDLSYPPGINAVFNLAYPPLLAFREGHGAFLRPEAMRRALEAAGLDVQSVEKWSWLFVAAAATRL
jgi:ubiquinone/menaquinone biosynthesis C-methylase UbiE